MKDDKIREKTKAGNGPETDDKVRVSGTRAVDPEPQVGECYAYWTRDGVPDTNMPRSCLKTIKITNATITKPYIKLNANYIIDFLDGVSARVAHADLNASGKTQWWNDKIGGGQPVSSMPAKLLYCVVQNNSNSSAVQTSPTIVTITLQDAYDISFSSTS